MTKEYLLLLNGLESFVFFWKRKSVRNGYYYYYNLQWLYAVQRNEEAC